MTEKIVHDNVAAQTAAVSFLQWRTHQLKKTGKFTRKELEEYLKTVYVNPRFITAAYQFATKLQQNFPVEGK